MKTIRKNLPESLKILLAALGLGLFAACASEESTEGLSTNKDFIRVEGEVNMGSSETSKALQIEADCRWEITLNNAWEGLAVDPMEYEGRRDVTITSPENLSVAARTAQIIVSNRGGIRKEVTLRQLAGSATLSLSETTHTFESVGGTWAFTITCNTDWVITGAATGFRCDKMEGTGNASVEVVAEANTVETARQLVLTIMAGTEKAELTITQKGVATLSATPTQIDAYASQNNYNISIVSNTTWTAAVNQSWLTLSQNSGEGNSTISVSCQNNTSLEARSAVVTITYGNGQNVQITLTQAAATLPVITDIGVTELGSNSATVSATYASADYVVMEYGLYYGTEPDPVQQGIKLPFTGDTFSGSVSYAFTSLSAGTTYYVCIYATCAAGTALGEVFSFTTSLNRPGTDDNDTPILTKKMR